jgi:hypothetical protein
MSHPHDLPDGLNQELRLLELADQPFEHDHP